MKKKRIIFISIFFIVCCATFFMFIKNDFKKSNDKTIINETKIENNKTSGNGNNMAILGDSISTFEGFINGIDGSAENMSFYDSTVMSVNETWWRRIANTKGWYIMSNESIGNTRVTWDGTEVNNMGIGQRYYMAGDSRIDSLGRNGAPDKIFIFGGTNDYLNGVNPGKIDEIDLNDVTVFTNAYSVMINKIKNKYPNADIICLAPYVPITNPDAASNANAIADAIVNVSRKYNCKYADLRNITFVNEDFLGDVHPSSSGMEKIANYVLNNVNFVTMPDSNWSISGNISLDKESNYITVSDKVNINVNLQNNLQDGICGTSYSNSIKLKLSSNLTLASTNDFTVKLGGSPITTFNYSATDNSINIELPDEIDCDRKISISGSVYVNQFAVYSNLNELKYDVDLKYHTYNSETMKTISNSEKITKTIKSPNNSISTTINNADSYSINDKVKITNIIKNNTSATCTSSTVNDIILTAGNLIINNDSLNSLKIYINGTETTGINASLVSNSIRLSINSINCSDEVKIEYDATIDKTIVSKMDKTNFKVNLESHMDLSYYLYDYYNRIQALSYLDSQVSSRADNTKEITLKTGKLYINYVDSNDQKIAESKTIEQPLGSLYEFNAITIENYSLVSENLKSGTVEDGLTITFKYKIDTGEKVIQKYLDENNEAITPAKNMCENQDINSKCELTCPTIEHYALKTNEPFSTNLTYNIQTMECKYVKIALIKVIYKDENGVLLKEDSISDEIGNKVSYEPKGIDKYKLIESPDISNMTFTKEDQEIVYKYQKTDSDITIKYVDENGKEIGNSKVVRYPIDSEQIIKAASLKGYEIKSGINAIKLKVSKEDSEISFIYKKSDSLVNPQTGNFIPVIGLILALVIAFICLKSRKKLFYKI